MLVLILFSSYSSEYYQNDLSEFFKDGLPRETIVEIIQVFPDTNLGKSLSIAVYGVQLSEEDHPATLLNKDFAENVHPNTINQRQCSTSLNTPRRQNMFPVNNAMNQSSMVPSKYFMNSAHKPKLAPGMNALIIYCT